MLDASMRRKVRLYRAFSDIMGLKYYPLILYYPSSSATQILIYFRCFPAFSGVIRQFPAFSGQEVVSCLSSNPLEKAKGIHK